MSIEREKSKTFTTREMVADDITAVLPMLHESWLENAENSEIVSEEFFEKTNSAEWLEGFLANEGHGVVAEMNGEIAGAILFQIETSPEYYVTEKHLMVMDVVVGADYRRLGIATQLEKEAEDFARENNISLVLAEVWAYNEKSKRLMKELGCHPLYVVYGRMVDE